MSSATIAHDPPTVGSLFTGVGGFDLGFERAGFKVAYQVEFDKACQAVLQRHWPDVALHGDIRDATGLPITDVLVGGFPCQDLSVAGKRAGLTGERSGLFWEYARIIGEAKPQWVVIENVPGLLSSNRGADMGTVLGALEELGYGWAYACLDAQFFGVPQRRRRIFIVGCLGDSGRRAAQVLLEPESLCGNPPPSREAGQAVAGTLGGGAGARDWSNDLDRSGAFIPVAWDERDITSKTNRSRVAEGPTPTLHQGGLSIASTLRTTHNPAASDSYIAISGEGSQLEPTVSAKWHKGSGGPAGDECQNLAAYVPDVVSTLSGGAHPGGLNGQDAYTQAVAPLGFVRRLTPIECERLQGFPDNWTASQADSHRYRQMGNAVAVPVARWIAQRIARELN